MGSPAFFGKLVNFTAAARKNALIPFGTFSPDDDLSFIASLPGETAVSITTTAYASALVIDTSAAVENRVILTGNVASMVLNYAGSVTIPTGTRVWIRLSQDATGNRTVVLPTNLVVDSGFAVDPGASRTTVLPIEWNGSNWIFFDTSFSVQGA